MELTKYFSQPQNTAHKQYSALAAFYKDGLPAEEVARKFGYTLSAFYSLARNFKSHINKSNEADVFFRKKSPGRKKKYRDGHVEKFIVALRQRNLSNNQIQSFLSDAGFEISQAGIWRILSKNGFKKLPRRTVRERHITDQVYTKPVL